MPGPGRRNGSSGRHTGAAAKHSGKRRRAREKHAEDIDSLFAALTISEKRGVLSALGGAPSGAKLTDSDSVEQAILDSGRAVGEILETLRRTEIGSPKKHFFLATVAGNVAKAFHKAAESIGKQIAPDIVLSYKAELDEVFCFLLERVTRGYKWVAMDPQPGFDVIEGKQVTKVRHATVVRIHKTSGRASLNYHGLPTGIDYNYSLAIKGALEAIAKLGIHLEPLPIGSCVTAVIAAKGRRVVPVRGDLVTQEGELKLRSRAGKATIQQLVARLVEAAGDDDQELNEAEILDRITVNLGRHTFETIGLLWTDERVLVRVDFLDPGADLLFVWGGRDPSFGVADRMLGMLYELAAGLKSESFTEVWNSIVELADEHLLLPAHFRSARNAPADDIDAVLVEAVKLGLLLPVYQLKADTTTLDELGLFDWTPDVAKLRQRFTAEDVAIDGANPDNIRVAFRRIRARSPRQ